MTQTQASIHVTDTSQIGEARRTALRIATHAGFSETRRGEIAIVVTELATNLIRHATGGRVLVQRLRSSGAEWLELLAVDRGPGGWLAADGRRPDLDPGRGGELREHPL